MNPGLRRGWMASALWLGLLPGLAGAQEAEFLLKPLSLWVQELDSPQARVRRNAAFALGKVGERAAPAVASLVNRLRDPEPSVREASATALGELGEYAAGVSVPALGEVLQHDAEARVRCAAAAALGRLGPRATAAGPALTQALADANAAVRQNAAWAIGEVGEPGGAATVVALGRLLQDDDTLVRRDAAAALGTMGAAARPAFSTLLSLFRQDADLQVRKAAVTALVNVTQPEDQEAAPEFVSALADPDPEVVRAAALALGNIGGPPAAPAIPVLRDALRDEEPAVRRAAAAGLANVGPLAAPVVPELTRTLGDTEPAVRAAAAVALARIGTDARPAVPALLGLLRADEAPEVRLFATEALHYLQKDPSSQGGKLLQSDGLGIVPAVLRLVKEDTDHRVRQRAVWVLGDYELETVGAVDGMAAVLDERDPASRLVRYEAAVRLGVQLGSRTPEKAVDVLYAFLTDPDIHVYTGTKSRVSSAGTETKGGDAQVRTTGAGDPRAMPALALGRIGPKANRPEIVKVLEEVARAEDSRVRDAARFALARIKPR